MVQAVEVRVLLGQPRKMIPGFEEYTVDVTNNELEIIQVIAKCLNKRVGHYQSITNAEMRRKILDWNGTKISCAKMRKYIQYIRQENMCPKLCASPKGYWIAENNEEWMQYKENFAKRARAIQYTLACMNHHDSTLRVINKSA